MVREKKFKNPRQCHNDELVVLKHSPNQTTTGSAMREGFLLYPPSQKNFDTFRVDTDCSSTMTIPL